MWNDQTQSVRAQLESGEQLLWSGQPRQGLVLRPSDAFMIPFSLLWGGFAIFWEVSVILTGAPVFFWLFGVPFVLIGLHLIFGRFFTDARARTHTFYGLTNDRILITSGKHGRRVQSLSLSTLGDITLDERGDGSGTITFAPANPLGRMGNFGTWPGAGASRGQMTPRFEMIPQARKVYEMIRGAQRRLHTAARRESLNDSPEDRQTR
ncbi:MAG TPA: PH domain-containing protein [Pyrinomonadaceae bacterium]